MTEPVDIIVVREVDTWKVRYGSVELVYFSHAEAIGDAIALARDFGNDGRFSTVRMGVMTSCYGPSGFIRAFPNKKLGSVTLTPTGDLTTPVLEPLAERGETIQLKPSGKVPREEETTRPNVDKGGRVLRIASAFEISRQPQR